MIKGKWTTDGNKSDPSGKFNETPTTFRDRVTADGSSGFKAEAGRYHLYVSFFALLPVPCRLNDKSLPGHDITLQSIHL